MILQKYYSVIIASKEVIEYRPNGYSLLLQKGQTLASTHIADDINFDSFHNILYYSATSRYINPPESLREYQDTEVMTGVESWRDRTELQKLLTKAEALGKTSEIVVVVDHPDRFARGLDLVLLVELLTYYNARVEFVQQKFEDTDEGKLVLHLESYSSKKEWQRIKKRTHDGIVDRVYMDKNTPRAKKWYRPPVPPAIEVEDVVSLYPQRCIKVVGIGDAETLRDKRQELERIFAGKLYVTQSSFDIIEFLHPEVSKGNALQAIAADLGIAPQEVVAIGDNHNDIGMIRFAGLGVAMGNAHDEVKAAADYVTRSNAEEGVAVVIEKLILPSLR